MPMPWWSKFTCFRSGRRNRGNFNPTRGARLMPMVEILENRMLPSAGAIDPTFGHDGTLTLDKGYIAKAVAIEGDGKILVLAQSDANFEVLRFNTDGTPDTGFGDNGKVTGTWGDGTNVVNMALGSSGIVVAGSHGDAPASYLDVAEYNFDGTIDGSFGNNGLAEIAFGGNSQSASDIHATEMAIDGNGDIVVAASTSGGIAVVRLTPTGNEDTSFGGTGIVTAAADQASGLAVQGDNKIVVTAFAGGDLELLRYNTDGKLDSNFGNNGIVSAPLEGQTLAGARVAVEASDGKLVVTADSYSVIQHSYTNFGIVNTWDQTTPYFNLFRFNADGTVDAAFGKDGQVAGNSLYFYGTPSFHTLALEDNGKILVAASAPQGLVTRYDTDGTVDLTYGNGGTASTGSWNNAAQSAALAIQGDGKVVLASTSSSWDNDGYQTVLSLARFEADSDIRPAQFSTADALKQYLIEQAVQQYQWEFGRVYEYYPFYGSVLVPMMFPGLTASGATVAFDSASASSNTFSTTNTQEQGVDEGDKVKTDGQYLYVLSGDKLVILNAWPADQLETLSTTALDGNALALYLDGTRLTVISQVYGPIVDPPEANSPGVTFGWNCYAWWKPQVEVTVYDVSDPKNPAIVQQTKFDGNYNTSRAIGNTVYIALNNTLSLPGPEYTIQDNKIVYETEAQYRARMEALPLDTLLPHYTTYWTDSGGPEQDTELLTQPGDIYQPGVPGDTNLLSVVSLDITASLGVPTHTVSFLTSWGATLYAASDNFYLASTRWSYTSNWTFIDKLNLDASGDINLTATGRVPGTILNQFSMGENGAYFYIATTTGWWHNASNNVFVLSESDHSLNVVGSLEGIAPGEVITAVRFMGDRGFVSTFYQRDPLFALDLSDPTNPRVAGELQVSGMSGYLQLLDPNHLLDIGWQVLDRGVEITLFDISNLNNPTVISRYDVSPQGWSWTNASYDYHAITYYPQYQTLTLPVSSEVQVTGLNRLWPCWIYQTNELVFHVDPTSGLEFQGQVSDGSQISRGVFINNMLYTISDTTVQAQALENLSQVVAHAALPLPNYYPWWWRWGWEPVRTLPVTVVEHRVVKTGPPKPPAGNNTTGATSTKTHTPAVGAGTPTTKPSAGLTGTSHPGMTLTAAPAPQTTSSVLVVSGPAPVSTAIVGAINSETGSEFPAKALAHSTVTPAANVKQSHTGLDIFDAAWDGDAILDDSIMNVARALATASGGRR